MVNTIRAVYENGVLRPLEPLALEEHQLVWLQFVPEGSSDQTATLVHALTAAGLITAPSGEAEISPLSETERQQLAMRLGQTVTKPPSQIIIEERGE